MSKPTFPPCSVCGQPSTCNFEVNGNGRRVYFCAGHGTAFVKTMRATGAYVSYDEPAPPLPRATSRKRGAPAAPARRQAASDNGCLYQLLGAAAIVVVVMVLLLVLTGGLK